MCAKINVVLLGSAFLQDKNPHLLTDGFFLQKQHYHTLVAGVVLRQHSSCAQCSECLQTQRGAKMPEGQHLPCRGDFHSGIFPPESSKLFSKPG